MVSLPSASFHLKQRKLSNCNMYIYKVCLLVMNFKFLWPPYFFSNNSVTESLTVNNFENTHITLVVYFKTMKGGGGGGDKLHFNSSFYPPQTKGT